MFEQDYTPLGGSLGLSALMAALPLVSLFILLGIVRMKAWLASLIGLAMALLVAIAGYGMPIPNALASASEGAAFGLFPAMWIVMNAIWVYQLTVHTGHFDVLRRSFGRISSDQRVQAIIIAFCFGALMEALAGFGTPVAICAVMLIALGFKPLKAATVALVANTAPVAFGAVGLPIVTLAQVTGLPEGELAATVGRQTPVLAVLVPFALVFIVDGWRGLRETWPAALVGGAGFGIAQFAMATYGSIALTDIVAAFVGAGALVLLLRIWEPTVVRSGGLETSETVSEGGTLGDGGAAPAGSGSAGGSSSGGSGGPSAGGSAGPTAERGDTLPGRPGDPTPASPAGAATTAAVASERVAVADSRRDVLLAYLPYLVIVVVFSLVKVPAIDAALNLVTYEFTWPGVDTVDPKGEPLAIATYVFNWLPNIGTLLLLIGAVTAATLRISVRNAVRVYGETVAQLRGAIVTVAAVLALAYVMNISGQTITLGLLMAQVGSAFAVMSPIVGWLGTAVSGSDTSSNSLFGTLQVSAAKGAGLDPLLTAAGNSSGGVLGKMISPQNLAVGAAAVAMAGREGDLFRKVFGWTLVFLVFMCALVYLQSTPVLSWMLP